MNLWQKAQCSERTFIRRKAWLLDVTAASLSLKWSSQRAKDMEDSSWFVVQQDPDMIHAWTQSAFAKTEQTTFGWTLQSYILRSQRVTFEMKGTRAGSLCYLHCWRRCKKQSALRARNSICSYAWMSYEEGWPMSRLMTSLILNRSKRGHRSARGVKHRFWL